MSIQTGVDGAGAADQGVCAKPLGGIAGRSFRSDIAFPATLVRSPCALGNGLGIAERRRLGATFVHPVRGPVSLDHLAALYAWHGLHHVAQITGLRERQGWIRAGARHRSG